MARKRKFDMSKVESFKRCAEGVHTAKIVEVQENTTQAGDDMLTMAFEVIKGESKDARVYDNFVLTDKALWKLKQLLQSLGIKCDGKIVLDLDKLVGKICDITVYHEEYNGKTKARIDEYTAIKRQDPEDDEYDEDEDTEPEDNEPEEKPEPKKASTKGRKKPEPKPEPEDKEDEDWDDDEEEDEPKPEEKPKKKPAAKPEPKKKAPAKKRAEPEPEDEDWDDDDEDWDE